MCYNLGEPGTIFLWVVEIIIDSILYEAVNPGGSRKHSSRVICVFLWVKHPVGPMARGSSYKQQKETRPIFWGMLYYITVNIPTCSCASRGIPRVTFLAHFCVFTRKVPVGTYSRSPFFAFFTFWLTIFLNLYLYDINLYYLWFLLIRCTHIFSALSIWTLEFPVNIRIIDFFTCSER